MAAGFTIVFVVRHLIGKPCISWSISGLAWCSGLVIFSMADPTKVLNFLDLFGNWDPSPAFAKGGAVVVGYFGYRLVFRRERPIAGEYFHLPATLASTAASSLVPWRSDSIPQSGATKNGAPA